jgi:1-phosphatidylinositol-4-phosphate 5-kinase
LFREIRKKIFGDNHDLLIESFLPSMNLAAIHNFRPGSGKSPSFFFFSDNNIAMIKTLKPSEFDILLKTDFLIDYFKHLEANPGSLLSRILGIYEVKVSNGSPMVFFITENMLGGDG